MRLLHRRREVLPLREVMRDHVYPSDCAYVAVPMPEVAAPDDPTLGPGPFLEGGDVLVLGKRVFAGTSGLASNPLGIQWLAKFLAPYGYTVEKVRLHRRILHGVRCPRRIRGLLPHSFSGRVLPMQHSAAPEEILSPVTRG